MTSYRLHAANLLKKFFNGDISRIASERNRLFSNNRVERQNQTRFNDLIHGVVRRYRSLDSVISTYSDYPLRDLEPELLGFLRIALYEILFFDSVPDPVAVNEAVEQTRQQVGKNPANLANAVLRTINRELTDEIWQFPDDIHREGTEHLFPIRNNVCREFKSVIFPKPSDGRDALISYLSRAFNYPRWICKTWTEAYSSEKALDIARYQAEIPPQFIRRNPQNISKRNFEERLAENGITYTQIGNTMFYRLKNNLSPKNIPGFSEGDCTIQDPGTGRALEEIDLTGLHSFLDVCAAPGGKTTQIHELGEENITGIAMDRNRDRISSLVDTLKRMNCKSNTVIGDGRWQPFSSESFDLILLDVPCSNTGVLGRRVEARYHLENGLDEELINLQKQLLQRSISLVKPDGKLVYITCSLLPEENDQILASGLVGHENVRLNDTQTLFPTQEIPSGGFYAEINVAEQ